MKQPIITLAMTGASGARYGLRLLEYLLQSGIKVYFLLSQPAQMVLHTETDWRLPSKTSAIQDQICERFNVDKNLLQVFGQEQWTAPIASGSHRSQAMVVCPCTAGTLANIAAGTSRNLLDRAADVMLKEQRKLILVVRETPFSIIHLQNMLKLAQQGVVILPANPGFYNKADSIDDLVDFIVARILDHLGIDHELQPRWGEQ